MRLVCTEILSSIFFPLLSSPRHPAPLAFSRSLISYTPAGLRPAGRFAEYLSRRLVMRWKRSKTVVDYLPQPPLRRQEVAGKITGPENVSVFKNAGPDTYIHNIYRHSMCVCASAHYIYIRITII